MATSRSFARYEDGSDMSQGAPGGYGLSTRDGRASNQSHVKGWSSLWPSRPISYAISRRGYI
jgi:hypothetical protein